MQPLIPSRAAFLGRPTKPSRLFVILFVVSAVVNALLLINFGFWESRLLLERQSWRNSLALSETQTKTAQDELTAAKEDIEQKDARLADLDKQLADATAKLKKADSDLTTLNAQVKSQESQLAKNSSELQALRDRPPLFKFESATGRDVATAKSDVETVVTKAYDIITNLYGQPYILHQVTIRFVDSLGIAGAVGEIEIENSAEGISITIKITDFSKNNASNVDTIVHEIIHAFHGVAALNAPVMEEGITVAATDEVMSRLAAQGVIGAVSPYIHITDDEAINLNATLGVPPSDSSFYSLPKSTVQQFYQLTGWTWRRLATSRSDFYRSFNEALYSQVSSGNKATPSLVRTIAGQTAGVVDSQGAAVWLAGQIVFNPS